jgi:hypothetical protein
VTRSRYRGRLALWLSCARWSWSWRCFSGVRRVTSRRWNVAADPHLGRSAFPPLEAHEGLARRPASLLVVEQLPGYAHDLNPMDLIWGNLKSSELTNLCPDTINEAVTWADQGLDRIGSDANLCFAFLRHCGLEL